MGQSAQPLRDEEGQGLAEYALLLALVALLLIISLSLLGITLGDIFTAIAKAILGRRGRGRGRAR
ncbi:MAG: Flp family type IVb pilin [Nitrospinota bacterium]